MELFTLVALFARSGETVSRQFHTVLRAVLKIGKHYIKEVDTTTSFVNDPKWKWFEGVVGALDDTHIDMTVPLLEDRGLYNQVSQGNKGDGEWKPQAYQAVVDEVRSKLNVSDTTSMSSKKKRKSDSLADAVTQVADTLKSYVEARLKATPTLGGKEVFDEVSKVVGILRPQVLRAVNMFVEMPVKFQVLKDLPSDQKLDWILLCLDERSRSF
ncbi:hypothetical protein KSS87_018555 [Heliosperma pusillum]|nr:hypothetical protein KSS87_018555 [Heliosperma pusillum]